MDNGIPTPGEGETPITIGSGSLILKFNGSEFDPAGSGDFKHKNGNIKVKTLNSSERLPAPITEADGTFTYDLSRHVQLKVWYKA